MPGKCFARPRKGVPGRQGPRPGVLWIPSSASASDIKKASPKAGFDCPKAGEDLLLGGSSRGGRGGRSGSRGSGSSSRSGSASHAGHASHALLGFHAGHASGGASHASHAGGSASHAGHASHTGGSFGGLRSLSSGLRSFGLGRLGGLRGFGLAASGETQGEQGSYEERLLHLSSSLTLGSYLANWLILTFPFRSIGESTTAGHLRGTNVLGASEGAFRVRSWRAPYTDATVAKVPRTVAARGGCRPRRRR